MLIDFALDTIAQVNSGQSERGRGEAEKLPEALAASYDRYFLSGDYDNRYPSPNRATLARILGADGRAARRILDFGCGNGRYSIALLEHTEASITGFDISLGAIAEFRHRLAHRPGRSRITLVQGQIEALTGTGPFDVILMMFGVLSHIGDRNARVAALQTLRTLVAPTRGALVISVPNILRRRPKEVLLALRDRYFGRNRGSNLDFADIYYSRIVGGREARLFYHLYTVKTLREELAEGGFALRASFPESLFPESMVTRSPALGAFDEMFLPWLPVSLGYGICAVASPV